MKRLNVDLSGRAALVTGANSGMGKETARELARMGADVLLGCRSTQRGELARAEIADSTGATAVSVMELDPLDSSALLEAAPDGDLLSTN
jgi:NAD(P)-dependent dehydrogenase (short-subunit alcohol dehydrogenase family)